MAGVRRRVRELALRALYEADVGRQPLAAVLERVLPDVPERERPFLRALCEGAWTARRQLDALLAEVAPQWSVDRLAGTDRAILRLAAYELQHMDTPPAVVINEAVELAKAYGTEDSGKFVNGVLAAVLRRVRERSGVRDG
ncbi:MAG: transcription antitermination factor NusB [Armatimonadota bacterium]|nr:transcription antitermination factor NusB [Armatimonadota bacterium]MDR7400630.1 transcription antitermination factor NusB [Armatimonadota bacterium]MDR7403158.1 transcription antitermination factor NusB [Armatimonadota bacterium]MDR7436560.1 transcription antitermination factor NusB [Armatimonadota bacterium]MDR7472595.1 transcription antitermination factor NusB [Armatimonadota bacterium]